MVLQGHNQDVKVRPMRPQPFDPRGACATCRHFIADRDELAKEMKFISNNGKIVLHTAERTGGENVRTVDLQLSVAQAIRRVTGLPIERIGLCEVGVARFVDREAGKLASDKCSRWKERGSFHKLRPNWRELRGYPEPTPPPQIPRAREIRLGDPCVCQSGKTWGRCCGIRLGLIKEAQS